MSQLSQARFKIRGKAECQHAVYSDENTTTERPASRSAGATPNASQGFAKRSLHFEGGTAADPKNSKAKSRTRNGQPNRANAGPRKSELATKYCRP